MASEQIPLDVELAAMTYDESGNDLDYRRGWNAAMRAAIAIVRRRHQSRFEGEFGEARS